MGAIDANGVYIYSEDDPASPFSDLLNLGQSAQSVALGDLDARVADLEDAAVRSDITGVSNFSYGGSGFTTVTYVDNGDGVVHVLGGRVARTTSPLSLASSFTIATGLPAPATASVIGGGFTSAGVGFTCWVSSGGDLTILSANTGATLAVGASLYVPSGTYYKA